MSKAAKTEAPARPRGILHFVRGVDNSVFFQGKGAAKVADYAAIFVDAVHEYLKAKGVKHDRPTLVAIASNVNLSSFQRAAANESRRRGGVRCQPMPEKVAKAKPVDPATGERVKSKRKPAVDPIDGTPIKRATKAKAAKPAKAPASKPTKAAVSKVSTAAKLKAGAKRDAAAVKPPKSARKAKESAAKPNGASQPAPAVSEVAAEVEF